MQDVVIGDPDTDELGSCCWLHTGNASLNLSAFVSIV